nr:PAS domain-containing protein [uncultured Rhodoferax sp.]
MATRGKPADPVRSELDRLQAVYETCTEGLVVLEDWQCIFMNALAEKLLRMTRREMSVDGLIRNLHPDDRAWYITRQKLRRAGKVVPNQFELRVVGPNDEERKLFIAETSIDCAYGKTTMVYLSGRRYQTTPKSEEFGVTKGATDASCESWSGMAYSINGKYIWINAAFARTVGYERDALIGQPLTMLYADPEVSDQLWRAQRQSLTAAGTSTTMQQIRRRNGELVHVQIKGQCAHRNDPDAGVIWTLLDTADELRQVHPPSQSVNQTAKPQASEIHTLQASLVEAINHELRTPLTAILSSAELLKTYGDRISHAETIQMLETIEQSVQRITQAIDQTLKVTNDQLQQLMKEQERHHYPRLNG